ncbi:MAG TPA: hypothetical protein VF681_10350 [Abditibacteriaceae bacterium]
MEDSLSNGVRVLLSGQGPHWLRENLGACVWYYRSRRLFKVGNNTATGGLDETDLRDWRGHRTLPKP